MLAHNYLNYRALRLGNVITRLNPETGKYEVCQVSKLWDVSIFTLQIETLAGHKDLDWNKLTKEGYNPTGALWPLWLNDELLGLLTNSKRGEQFNFSAHANAHLEGITLEKWDNEYQVYAMTAARAAGSVPVYVSLKIISDFHELQNLYFTLFGAELPLTLDFINKVKEGGWYRD